MKNIVNIFDISPQLVDLEFGAEPSLKEIIMEYYLDFVDEKEAKKFTKLYIKVINDALLKDYNG